jgi:recombinational DNA repair protein (RecF pathway)
LHALREVQLTKTHAELRRDLAWVHQASYFGVLIELGTEAETPIREVYELFAAVLKALPLAKPRARTVLSFELKFLNRLGYAPDLSALGEEAAALARILLESSFEELGALKTSVQTHQEVNRFVQIAVGTAFERLPPQREKALEALLPKTTGLS